MNGRVRVRVRHGLARVAHVQEGLQVVLPQPFGDQLILMSTKLPFFTIRSDNDEKSIKLHKLTDFTTMITLSGG